MEASLAEASNKSGLWRFELLSSEAAGASIRVVAGEVVALTSSSVTFRLRGRPGERVVFTFAKD